MLTITRWLTAFLILVTVVALVAGGTKWWYKWKYPYGWSHCCDKQLEMALYQYAEEHGGAYPAGEATPEASLSLLYPKYANANLLSGKTVPVPVVQAFLERGERLGPDTCGWHYVEGLTLKDDRRLALCWGKVPLGHNGQRTDGGQVVLFVNLGQEYIAGATWEAFLEEQKQLHEERSKKRAEK
jgi:hypothetical protein